MQITRHSNVNIFEVMKDLYYFLPKHLLNLAKACSLSVWDKSTVETVGEIEAIHVINHLNHLKISTSDVLELHLPSGPTNR